MEHLREFTIYGLRKNPFPHHGSFPVGDEDEETYANIFCGNSELKRAVEAKVSLLREGEGSSIVLVVGEYGAGKTHVLKYMEHMAQARFPGVIPLYIKRMEVASMLELYRCIVRAMEQKLTRDFLVLLAAQAHRAPPPRVRSFPDMERALAHLMAGDMAALRWIEGLDLSREELDRMEVSESLNSSSAVDALVVLVDLLWRFGRNKLLVLVDEFEETFVMSSRQDLVRFYSDLRQLLDKLPEGALLVLSATTIVLKDPEKSLSLLNPALDSRISDSDRISLKRLSTREVVEMLKGYLRAFRTPEAKGLVSDSFPFTEEALIRIAELSGGMPRNALKMASTCLSEALRRGVRSVDEVFVLEVLEEGGERREEHEEVEVRIARDRGGGARESEVREERKVEEEEIVRIDLSYVKRRIMEVLREEGSIRDSDLRRRVGVSKELYLEGIRALARQGLLHRKKRGRGYRVYLGRE